MSSTSVTRFAMSAVPRKPGRPAVRLMASCSSTTSTISATMSPTERPRSENTSTGTLPCGAWRSMLINGISWPRYCITSRPPLRVISGAAMLSMRTRVSC